MNRFASTALIGACLFGVNIPPVAAAPGPDDPGYCGARESAMDCLPYDGPVPPQPNPQEAGFIAFMQNPGSATAFITNASEGRIFRVMRGACAMLPDVRAGYIVSEIASRLDISMATANEVLGAAMAYSCPGARIAYP